MMSDRSGPIPAKREPERRLKPSSTRSGQTTRSYSATSSCPKRLTCSRSVRDVRARKSSLTSWRKSRTRRGRRPNRRRSSRWTCSHSTAPSPSSASRAPRRTPTNFTCDTRTIGGVWTRTDTRRSSSALGDPGSRITRLRLAGRFVLDAEQFADPSAHALVHGGHVGERGAHEAEDVEGHRGVHPRPALDEHEDRTERHPLQTDEGAVAVQLFLECGLQFTLRGHVEGTLPPQPEVGLTEGPTDLDRPGLDDLSVHVVDRGRRDAEDEPVLRPVLRGPTGESPDHGDELSVRAFGVLRRGGSEFTDELADHVLGQRVDEVVATFVVAVDG